MKLVTLQTTAGPALGALRDDDIVDLSRLGVRDVGELLAGPGLQVVQAAIQDAPSLGGLSQVRLLPPVLKPQRIICVGANYDLHRKEMGREALPYPTLFVRWPSSLVGHAQNLLRPSVSERFDYEGELALVMGKYGEVAGYTCFNDGSVRDYQRHTTQFTPGKNFDGSGAMGPFFVSADEVKNPHDLTLTTRLNGEVMQLANTEQMSFKIPDLLKYIGTFTTLEPGDIIATGTPSGVGDKRKPPVYLKPGDQLEVEISEVGCLTVGVQDRQKVHGAHDGNSRL